VVLSKADELQSVENYLFLHSKVFLAVAGSFDFTFQICIQMFWDGTLANVVWQQWNNYGMIAIMFSEHNAAHSCILSPICWHIFIGFKVVFSLVFAGRFCSIWVFAGLLFIILLNTMKRYVKLFLLPNLFLPALFSPSCCYFGPKIGQCQVGKSNGTQQVCQTCPGWTYTYWWLFQASGCAKQKRIDVTVVGNHVFTKLRWWPEGWKIGKF